MLWEKRIWKSNFKISTKREQVLLQVEPIRAVCEVVGIKDIVAKSLGSSNSHNVVRACIKGFIKSTFTKKYFFFTW